ncbi:alpha/beta fold hydrolase [Pseudocolwellia agarivorans]|uniref:alpha/beta fold hydrolase n=1 Tax=Pseudocolwellia agarivorans TaxID=1911682 RepID=UPI000987382A|nr:alpha/beta hydrolase [Pseudocolwellia agarivorans]
MKIPMKNIEEVVFKTASSQISALSFNKNANNIILCLHGWLDNAASFMPLFEHLDGHSDFNVIAIDLPGHGASSHKSADAHYHFIDWVYDILVLFESNKWSNIHIVGHSMGGMIASAFSAAFPEKVKSLTLIDSIGFMYGDEKESTSILRKGMLSRIKASSRSTQSKKSSSLSLDVATRARVLISDLEYRHAELIVARNLLNTGENWKWRSDRRLNTISPYRLSLAQCQQLISDIKAPVQVIYGSKGLDFVRKGIEFFGPLMSSQKIVELEGGHHVHMEKPKETAKLINEFITSI